MGRVTEREIKEINELYAIYQNYSRVAQEVGRAASTVKRYVDPDYIKEEKELRPVNWSKLKAAPLIDLMEGTIGGYTGAGPYDETMYAYYLDSTPIVKGKYIIANHFDSIPMPRLDVSYRTVEARLLGMNYEEYLVFCEECLGAVISRNEGAKYAAIYFDNTTEVQKLITLMNQKFGESYEQSVLHKEQ